MPERALTHHPAAILGLVPLGALLALPALAAPYTLFVAAQMIALLYVALALELSHSFGRVLSFCTGTFFALGAYVAFYACRYVSGEVTVALLLGTGAAAAAGLLTALMVVRMQGSHTAVVGTLAVAAISLLVANGLNGVTDGEDGLTLRAALTLGGQPLPVGVTPTAYYLALAPVAACLVAYLGLRSTPFGLVMRAVGENEERSRQLGFDVTLRRIVVVSAAAGLSGLGGALNCILLGHVSTALLDPVLSLNAVLWATVGGLGSPFGALIGTLIVYPAVEFASGLVRLVDAVVGLLLIGTALLFPRGIVGALDRLAERAGGPARPAAAITAAPQVDEPAATHPLSARS